jgi:hypothetical protein
MGGDFRDAPPVCVTKCLSWLPGNPAVIGAMCDEGQIAGAEVAPVLALLLHPLPQDPASFLILRLNIQPCASILDNLEVACRRHRTEPFSTHVWSQKETRCTIAGLKLYHVKGGFALWLSYSNGGD